MLRSYPGGINPAGAERRTIFYGRRGKPVHNDVAGF